MAKLVFFTIGLFLSTVMYGANFSFQVIDVQSLPTDYTVEKKRIGGLSGCVFDSNTVHFVSDDHGEVAGARVISFPYDFKKNKIDFSKGKNLLIKKEKDQKILDLEGIGILPNGNFLLSTEGDLNKRPRVLPQIFEVDKTGVRKQVIELPSEFIPEKSGQQTKGIQNNQAFEGLNVDLSVKKWGAFLEGALQQKPNTLFLIEGGIELSPLKVEKQWSYPNPTPMVIDSLQAYLGVTDFLYKTENTLIVLERGVEVSLQGMSFQTQLCFAEKQSDNKLSRECVMHLNADEKLSKSVPNGANFEGLCWLNKEKTEFLMVSDNNFSSKDKTYFVWFKIVNK